MFAYFSAQHGTPGRLFRLNYAIDMRYGVLHDVGRKVRDGETIDLSMGHVNVIWQGDANRWRCVASRTPRRRPRRSMSPDRRRSRCDGSPPSSASCWARRPSSPASRRRPAGSTIRARMVKEFGPPSVPLQKMIEWTADWLARDMATLNKPTHYEVRDGQY